VHKRIWTVNLLYCFAFSCRLEELCWKDREKEITEINIGHIGNLHKVELVGQKGKAGCKQQSR